MNDKKPGIEPKSGYLEFNYPAENELESARSYQAGLRIFASLKLFGALKKASVEMNSAVMEEISLELAKLIVTEIPPAYGLMCAQIEDLSAKLPAIVKEAGPLKTESAQAAFRSLLASKIISRARY